MSCTRHFMNVEWEHHTWHRRVSSTETLPVRETNMWGRVVETQYVRCHKQDVCDACGQTRGDVACICDTAIAARCASRLACLGESHHVPE